VTISKSSSVAATSYAAPDEDLLGWGEGRLRAMWCVSAIGNAITVLPATDGILSNT